MHGIDRLAVGTCHRSDVFRASTTTFNFKNPDAGSKKLVHEVKRRDIVRAHDKLIVYLELLACFIISDGVFFSTVLFTGSSVS